MLRSLLLSLCALIVLPLAVQAEDATFGRQGLEFLKKHCLDCHNADLHEGEFRLDTFTDEASLVKGRKQWEKVLDRIQAGEMPPVDQPRPEVAEMNAFVHLVTAIYDKVDREAKPDPGRVTVRRLNRSEYANTVRDLTGVDFDPTEDFPTDDIGHGFDNIGDVLSLPPVLLERYLAAAESISQRAIATKPQSPPKRPIAARFAEPSGAPDQFRRRQFRPWLPEKTDSPADAGPLHVKFDFEDKEEYKVRVRLSADYPKEFPLQVCLLACGCGTNLPGQASPEEVAQLAGPAIIALTPVVILKTFDITNRDPKDTDPYEAMISRIPGVKRLAVAVKKWPEANPPPKLFAELFEIEGPLDFRPESHKRILACTPEAPKEQQVREIVTRFVNRAYRRPGTPDEIDRLTKLALSAQAAGESWEASFQQVLQAVLVSPKFLFRLELDDRPEAPETRDLDEYQLASRMSYFLWSSMPDEELFDLASKGQLTANLETQVQRMLKDPRSRSLVDNFAMQWLQLRRIKIIQPDSKQFPQFDERLRRAMLGETERFLTEIIREDRSLMDLIDADFTYLNEPLARLYGIVDTAGTLRTDAEPRAGGERIRGDEFVRVKLADKTRGGLLTQASILTVTSNPTRTSPVKRGKWILEQMLGTPPPPPPPNVPELKEDDKSQLTGSLRQRLEQHRANPACANCHARMDPIGFALENYNAIGAFRTKDGEFEIDSAARFSDGTAFSNAAELKTVLRETRKDQVRRCVAEKLLTYALGRGLEYYDRPTLARIQSALSTDDRFSRLVLEIIKSDPFRQRRGKGEG